MRQALSRRSLNALILGGVSAGLFGYNGQAAQGASARRILSPGAALDRFQLGHLQHIKNLAALPDGDWSKMGANDPEQAGLSSYRYQLAYMAYALGIAHYHHLPAAPGVVRGAYEDIMRKMLRYDVWAYWFDTSRSGPRLDPSLTELRKPWRDPVVRENIMYSGHVLAMAGLYAVLFDDDRYAAPGALTFAHTPMFWGAEPFSFEYDFSSLKETIFWQMVENGWLGVECEPNNIFIVCNQFPILGFRFHDLRHGTAEAQFATRNYLDAWADKGGFVADNGSLIATYMVKQGVKTPPYGLDWDAWTGAVLHAWNPDLARALFNEQAPRYFRHHKDGRVSLYPASVVPTVMEHHEAGKASPDLSDPTYAFASPALGYAAIWLSELGDQERLEGLLAHANRYMNPSWERGGLYYPRHDQSWNADGELVFMEPFTGNALLGYSRLNPPGGLHALCQHPWPKHHFEQPILANDPRGVYISRAHYKPAKKRLDLRIEPILKNGSKTTLRIERGKSQNWTVFANGEEIAVSFDGRMRSADSVAAILDGASAFEITFAPVDASNISIIWR